MTKALNAEVKIEHLKLIAIGEMETSFVQQIVAMHFEADFLDMRHLI